MQSNPHQELADKIAQGGPGIRAQLKRMIGRLLGRHRLAEKVFLGPDGQLTPAARDWMAQLARDNFVNGGGFDIDPVRHAFNAGKRELALEILNSARLDTERLRALTTMERELE